MSGAEAASWRRGPGPVLRVATDTTSDLQQRAQACTERGTYAEASDLLRAALDQRPKDAKLWNALVHNAVGNLSALPGILAEMQRAGAAVDTYSGNLLLRRVAQSDAPERAQEAFDALAAAGYRADCIGHTTMVRAWHLAGDLQRAQACYRTLLASGVPVDGHARNVMLQGMCSHGPLDDALAFFWAMPDPDAVAYNIVLGRLARASDEDAPGHHACAVLDRMLGRPAPSGARVALHPPSKSGLAAERATPFYAQLLRALAEVPAPGALMNACITAIDALGKKQQAGAAQQIFDALKRRNVIPNVALYTALVGAWSQDAHPERAMAVLAQVRKERPAMALEPHVYGKLLAALSAHDRLAEAKELLDQLRQDQVPINTVMANTLVTALGRGRRPAEAQSLVARMEAEGPAPNVVTYGALMAAWAQAARTDRVLEAFGRLAAAGLTPTAPIFATVLDCFYKSGRHKDGVRWLDALAETLPTQALPHAAELYRKAKRYGEAQRLCAAALAADHDASEGEDPRPQAWIVQLNCLWHTDVPRFQLLQARPPFDATSRHWPRLLCLRIFAGHVPADTTPLRATLRRHVQDPAYAGLHEDLRQALQMLTKRAKPVT